MLSYGYLIYNKKIKLILIIIVVNMYIKYESIAKSK